MDDSADRTHSYPQPVYLKPASFSSLLQDIPEDLLFEPRSSTQSISTASSSSRSVNTVKSPASSIRSSATGSSRARKSVRFDEVASASTSISSFDMNAASETKPVEAQPTPATGDSKPRGWRQSLSRSISMTSLRADKKPEPRPSSAASDSPAQPDFEAWLTRMPKLDAAANAAEPRNQTRRARSTMAGASGVPDSSARSGRKGKRRQSWVDMFSA